MKKIITGIVALGLIAGAQVAPAVAGKAKPQVVEGSIALPAPYTDDSGCFAGLHRRVAIMTDGAANGDVGYHFDVDKATWGGKFKLEPTGGQGTIDMDILFYIEFGTQDDVLMDPQGAGAPASVGFQTRGEGGEAGIIPKDFNKAIVCIYGGEQGAGGGATFTYTGTPPKKK